MTEGFWQKSDCITDLATALAKAQAAMKPAIRENVNPHFRSRYADLASVWEACREALAANDLAVAQLPDLHGDEVGVTTLLCHKSGQWLSSRVAMVMPRRDPQIVGSAITYARRYGLAAMVGVAPEDDDAETTRKANGNGNAEPDPSPARTTIDDAQAKRLRALLKEAQLESAPLCQFFHVETIEDLPAGDYKRAEQAIERAKEKKANEAKAKATK